MNRPSIVGKNKMDKLVAGLASFKSVRDVNIIALILVFIKRINKIEYAVF